jgi:Ca-activated chloride channel family protein
LIVLITDGEDHESFPLDAAGEARDAGVHVIAVGSAARPACPLVIADPKTGAATTMMHDGAPVISKLDGDTLRQIAVTTEGVSTSRPVPRRSIRVDRHPARQADRPGGGRLPVTRVIPTELYPWWVLASLLALGSARFGSGPRSNGGPREVG